MIPHLRYAWVVARHKCFVLVAGLRVGAPLWRLLVHDFSKMTRAEWGPYVRRFCSGRAGETDKEVDPLEFHRAWTHHWHVNPHHWEYWLRLNGECVLKPMPIPEKFAREMVADWMGAGRAYTGHWDVRGWYTANAGRIRLAPETRSFVEALIERHGA